MEISQFNYQLPGELIAQHPLSNRAQSRLLVARQNDEFSELSFSQIEALVSAGDLLIVNNTRVLPARLIGHKTSGGKVEVFLERLINHSTARVMLKSNRPVQIGQKIMVEGNEITVELKTGGFFEVDFHGDAARIFHLYGETPLPPYIKRSANKEDEHRYQTVFSAVEGAVAAPTAGLHFDQPLIDQLVHNGVQVGEVTLHVGAGTFKPMAVSDISQHQMHSECAVVDAEICEKVKLTKQRGGKVIAVGTTVVRALESAALSGEIMPFDDDTDLYIRPGFKFSVVDAMVTNFHLPKSSLLVMVSAFAGLDRVREAYQYAIDRRFRFFSYGDAVYFEKCNAV